MMALAGDSSGDRGPARRFAATLQLVGHRVGRLTGRPRSDAVAGPGTLIFEPVLVRGAWGRVGSTLLMQLLGTSAEIAFDRAYPCENRCLSSLLRYLEPLKGRMESPTGHWMDDPDRLWWVDPASFGFEVSGFPLAYDNLGVDRVEVHKESVLAVWKVFSNASMPLGERPPRYYAEKYGGYADVLTTVGIPYRVINLVRDPRDVVASVLAFDSKRGYYGFGRREEQSDDAYLASLLQAMRRRLDEMVQPLPGIPVTTVRYEDMVGDLAKVAGRLGDWLGLDLDPVSAVANRSDLGYHRTAASDAESIGRWREDLPADVADRIEGELGAHLDRLSYTRRSILKVD